MMCRSMRCHLLAVLTLLTASPMAMAQTEAVEAEKPTESPTAVDAAQIATWVEQLDSDVYREREAATQNLIDADAQAVEALANAAKTASPEASVRIAHILEQIYVNSKSSESIDASEAALEQFKTLQNPTLASRAEVILQANYSVREKRAIAEIKRLGGTIKYPEQQIINFNRNVPVDSQIEHIILSKKWKGGDEGLKHVRRLTELPVLYYINGVDVSDEALAELQKAMPKTRFQIRNPAYLGISGFPHTRGCQIMTVQSGSAAERAGLMIGDIITRFDERPIKDFDNLIKEIAACEPGDTIELTVIRFEDDIKLPVVLGEWGATAE